MSLKKLGAVLFCVLALGAVIAGSAFAENEWSEGTSAWYTGASPGTKSPDGQQKLFTASAAAPIVLESTLLGEHLKLEAGGLECEGCLVENLEGHAFTTGKLKLTKVKLLEPKPQFCSVETPIVTKVLKGTVGMKPETKGGGPLETVRVVPQLGETFLDFTLTGGVNCRVANTYKVVGALFEEALSSTGTFAKTQQFRFSQAIQQSAGTTSSMKLGTNPIWITGTANFTLTSEAEWAAEEK